MLKILKNKVYASLVVAFGITLFMSGLMFSGVFDSIHYKLSDRLYDLGEPSQDIVIIGIDEKSTQPAPFGLGRYTQWGRQNYADLLDNLIDEEPALIAFDIVFNNPSQSVPISKLKDFQDTITNYETNSEKLDAYANFVFANSDPYNIDEDNDFAEKITKAGNVILAFVGNESDVVLPIGKFAKSATLGFAGAHPDWDGIWRRAPLGLESGGQKYDSLALAAAKKFRGSDIEISSRDDEMLINYFADPFGYKMIPFVDVINGNFEPDTFKDKIVLVGVTSFKEIQDKALTPRSNQIPMPGVEVHANIIQTILSGDFLHEQSAGSQIFVIALISIGLMLVFNFVGIILSVLIALAAIIAYIFLARVFFERGLILNMIYPFIAIILTYLSAWVYRYFIADKKKREITSAFGHYVSEDIVKEIAKNPETLKLGGEKRVVTVFFSDIKDSTAHSEQGDIQLWVSQLNEYFTAMESIIKSSGGTLDKYEGDAIMGFWNAPITQDDHVTRAYATAIEMQKMLQQLNQKWQQGNRPQIEVRIGISTGEVIVGNFGSSSRFDYTVMGDTVNTASRLESAANKTYGTSIIVSGFPQSLTELFVFRELDKVILPGKTQSITLYELLGLRQELSQQTQQMLDNYSAGLKAYREKNFPNAIGHFAKNTQDKASKLLMERCEKLQKGQTLSQLDDQMNFIIINK